MSTPATTGPTRERITRKKWEEHPTPDDARVRHIYPMSAGDGTLTVHAGLRAICGYVNPETYQGDVYREPTSEHCIVCVDLDATS